MRIKYVGKAGLRVVEELVWSQGNGFEVEVGDVGLAAGLLTHEGFEVGDGEPLLGLTGMSKPTVAALVIEGVGSMGKLAGLDEVGCARLAKELRMSKARVLKWVELARASMGSADSAPSVDGEEE